MIRNALVTNMVEFAAFGLMASAVALWIVALAPIH